MAELTPCLRSLGGLAPRPQGLLLLFFVSWQATGVGSACPRDVSTQAHACFTGYSREYQNMQSSPKHLCCGVDVETLRAFCSSYMNAMACIKKLRNRCPDSASATIERSMANLHGAENALQTLCSDDRIIEVYARHQSCITKAGPTTELCFQRHLNTTDTVRLLATVDAKHISEFCSDMRVTLRCIQNNVRNKCGDEASQLAETLVKPMVRQSAKCDYDHVTKEPKSGQAQPASSSQDGSGGKNGCASGSLAWSSALAFLWLTAVMKTLVLCS